MDEEKTMYSNKEIPEWIRALRKGQLSFLETVRQPGPYGRFRYAPEGCFLPHEPLSSGYAFGILDKMKAYDDLEENKKREWADYLRSYQDAETGDFYSKEMENLCPPPEKNALDLRYLIRRMLTRNLSGYLKRMGFPPQYPVHHPEVEAFTDREKLIAHLDSFPWDKSPWGAGSHGSMTVGWLFERFKQGEEKFRKPAKWAIEYMLKKQDPQTGLWGSPSCPLYERVNGAYKVLIKLSTTFGMLPKYPEKIIDNAIRNYGDSSYEMDGCNEFDTAFVLAAALRATDYRKQEIQELVLSRLPLIKPFQKEDGGFSYFKDQCITTNAQVPLIDRPRPQSDMAGTATFVEFFWTAFTILDWHKQLDWTSLWEGVPEKPVGS
jgi:hypothetical protein